MFGDADQGDLKHLRSKEIAFSQESAARTPTWMPVRRLERRRFVSAVQDFWNDPGPIQKHRAPTPFSTRE
jgi:hypothetical protein